MAGSGTAQAAELKVLSPVALKALLNAVAPQVEQATGRRLVVVWGESGSIKADVERGEAFDVAVMTPAFVEELAGQGKLEGATRALIARSGICVAVRKGARKPDVGTVEAFKRALLDARSIGIVEQSASSRYLNGLFTRLGIADALKSKIKPLPGPAAPYVANGDPEIAITQISAVVQFEGVDVAGPLPPEIQLYTLFMAAASPNADAAARTLLHALVAPEMVPVLKSVGLDPPS